MNTDAQSKDRGIVRIYAGKVERRLARYMFARPVPMRNGAPIVSFTFDDVPRSAYTAGARILESHSARGTYFVSGGLCGSEQSNEPLMTADECADLHQRGHEIGCHTYSHRAAQDLDCTDMDAELARNRAFFGRVAGGIVLENFAYPFGSVSPAHKRNVQRRFHSCRGVAEGINTSRADLALLRACLLADNRADRARVDRLIGETIHRTGWLIFFTHDVRESPAEFGCTPALLDYAVAAAASAGCEVLTIRDALHRLARPQMP